VTGEAPGPEGKLDITRIRKSLRIESVRPEKCVRLPRHNVRHDDLSTCRPQEMGVGAGTAEVDSHRSITFARPRYKTAFLVTSPSVPPAPAAHAARRS
jgi:hypothetical protein